MGLAANRQLPNCRKIFDNLVGGEWLTIDFARFVPPTSVYLYRAPCAAPSFKKCRRGSEDDVRIKAQE